MKKIISFSAIIILFFVVACSEEFTTNDDETLLDVDTFFLEESNAEEALIGGSSTDQQNYQDIDAHTSISTTNGSIETTWRLFYRTIALSNLIVDKLDDSSTLSNKDRVLAEAKFFRAWCYFELTTMFGAVPLRLTLPTSATDFPTPKATQAEVYAQIELDLADAISGLPDKSGVSENFRVSSGAAQALMGKVLVFQEKYTESLPYFQAVISNGSHDLEANVSDVWSLNTEFGIESLVEIGYVSTGGITWDNIPWGGRMESNLHIQLMGPRGDGIFGLGDTGLINGWGFNYPTEKLAQAFEASGDVERKAATLLTESELIAQGGSVDPTVADGGVIWGYDGSIRTKYATKLEDTSTDAIAELNYTTNYRLYRYAEVLLLAAEAYNKAGQDASARTELNKVRQRAGLADIDASLAGDDLFEAIVDEKFLELAHEGQRFWDLVRWGKASTELSGTGYTSKNDLFPIPNSEIDKNTAMSAEDQNPGY